MMVFMSAQCLAASASIFYSGGVVFLDEPHVKINKIFGLRLSPLNLTTTSSDTSVYFVHTIENFSNATNKIRISVIYSSSAKGWQTELIKDDNGNGKHDEGENSKLGDEIELAEGASLNFFVKITCPHDAVSGDSGIAVINVSCSVKGGSSYLGYNGISYGGAEQAQTTDTMIVK